MYTGKHDVKKTLTVIFFKQSCTYLVKILLLMPAAEFSASPVDKSTAFGILELGTLHGNQHFSLVPG